MSWVKVGNDYVAKMYGVEIRLIKINGETTNIIINESPMENKDLNYKMTLVTVKKPIIVFPIF